MQPGNFDIDYICDDEGDATSAGNGGGTRKLRIRSAVDPPILPTSTSHSCSAAAPIPTSLPRSAAVGFYYLVGRVTDSCTEPHQHRDRRRVGLPGPARRLAASPRPRSGNDGAGRCRLAEHPVRRERSRYRRVHDRHQHRAAHGRARVASASRSATRPAARSRAASTVSNCATCCHRNTWSTRPLRRQRRSRPPTATPTRACSTRRVDESGSRTLPAGHHRPGAAAWQYRRRSSR